MSWIGEAVGGALGETVEKIGGAIKQFVTTDKDRLELEKAVEQIRLDAKAKADEIGVKYEELAAKNAEDVNKTMQSEAAAEHWPTYMWRPFIGFVFGAYIISLFVLPIFGITPVRLSTDEVLAITAILGVASWFRGKMQADPIIPTVNRG